MARQRMVTRTIKTKKVVALCLNTDTCEPSNEVFDVPCNIDGDEKIMKYLRKFDTPTDKAVSIVSITEEEKLYGMPESQFIKLAQPIEKTEAETETETEAAED